MYPSACRPFLSWQIISTKHPVDKREDRGEVMAIILRVFAMVPMVVLWSGENVLQGTEIYPGIGMDQYRMYGNKNDVYVENSGGKSKNV